MHFRELTERYRLDKILRSARTGTVLRAVDSRSGQDVAIKLITVAAPAALAQKAPQLESLGAALEGLRHPSFPLVIDSGLDTEGSAFLVMELLEGRTLDTLDGSPQRLLALLLQVVDGLEVLARRGLAHHNLTPDNIFVVSGPQGEQAKILGLASALFRQPGPAPAETVRFRAPEIAAPGESADWRADLYSFAAVACHLLGATVQPGEPPEVQMPFALTLELERIDALDEILERCLRRNPGERPSHQEVRDALRLALGGSIPAPAAAEPPAPSPVAATPRLVVVPPPPPSPTAPVRNPAPAAPVSEPEPSDLGELLSSLDDDLLTSPAPPPRAATPPTSQKVVPFQRKKDRPAATPAQKRLALLAGAGAALLAVIILAGVWWLGRKEPPPPPPVAKAPAPRPLPPRRPAAEVLAEAQLALADGKDEHAFEVLRTLNSADQASLSPDGCRALQSLQETLALAALERLPEDLVKGLKTGDLGRLRFVVAAATGQEASLPEPVRADLVRAREAADLYAQAEAAAESKAPVGVLEHFAALTAKLPKASDPLGLRSGAATVLENEVEALVREGRYADAFARLEPLRRTWPDREGLRERVANYERYQKAELEQASLLSLLPAAERRRKPHEALERLEGVEPTPHLAAQFAEVRKKFETQLAQLDKAPPQVSLREGFYLDYDQSRVVELSFRVKDDYMIRSIKMMARPEGGKMREMPLEKSTFGYDVEIPSSYHRNGTVDFYVVATDISGHEGWFGTPDRPQKVKRR